ncbi:MAG: tetraacyldisaccharide 4'-kinase [Legionellaceae bacterium]|nr:tetraacyldisaccharide 4'-kinase [Legionellaceae bacterium]
MLQLEKAWYSKHAILRCLLPLSWIYRGIICIRRFILTTFVQQATQTPLIVVGNLTTGGVGKTPLVLAIAKFFKAQGKTVGIVSRGYKAKVQAFPYEVRPNDAADWVGDEPALLAQRSGCPVVIAPRRREAVRYLEEKYAPSVIISDDGLQHYAMGRTLEILVIDGTRGFGNGYCLPAGPLREPVSRLKSIDLKVVNGAEWLDAYSMHYEALGFRHLQSGNRVNQTDLPKPLRFVTGIGNPQRFFQDLQAQGLEGESYIFPDHHQFCEADLPWATGSVVMTEKDAVKCAAFAKLHWYVYEVQAQLSSNFWSQLQRIVPCVHS